MVKPWIGLFLQGKRGSTQGLGGDILATLLIGILEGRPISFRFKREDGGTYEIDTPVFASCLCDQLETRVKFPECEMGTTRVCDDFHLIQSQ
jgi:hypothetical protein